MSEPIEHFGIRFTDTQIANVQDNRIYCALNRSEIVSMTFRWGILSQRTIIQVIFGSLVSLFGFYVIQFVYGWLTTGGTAFDVQVLLTLLFPLGVWITFDALKQGYYLELNLKSGKRKMVFQKKQEIKELEELSNKIKEQLNYEIRVLPR